MECEVVAGSAEIFGVDWFFSFAFFAGFDFGLPFDFFVAGVTEAFGVMLFLLIAVDAGFYYHLEKKRSHIK